jgi:hypothetical protein
MTTEKRPPFERDERLESLLRERTENRLRYEANNCFNDKRAVERYAELKAKHDRRNL